MNFGIPTRHNGKDSFYSHRRFFNYVILFWDRCSIVPTSENSKPECSEATWGILALLIPARLTWLSQIPLSTIFIIKTRKYIKISMAGKSFWYLTAVTCVRLSFENTVLKYSFQLITDHWLFIHASSVRWNRRSILTYWYTTFKWIEKYSSVMLLNLKKWTDVGYQWRKCWFWTEK